MNKCIWVKGLSASGKTTISTLFINHLRSKGTKRVCHAGDGLRQVLADDPSSREERMDLGIGYSRL